MSLLHIDLYYKYGGKIKKNTLLETYIIKPYL